MSTQKGHSNLLPIAVVIVLAVVVSALLINTNPLKKDTKYQEAPENISGRSSAKSENKVSKCPNQNEYNIDDDNFSYNLCYPKSWSLRETHQMRGKYLTFTGDNEESIITLKAYENSNFEGAKNIQENSTNPQFKIQNQRIINDTDKVFYTVYDYKVYTDSSVVNTTYLWLLRSTNDKNVYFEIQYPTDSTFNQKTVEDNVQILNDLANSVN